jgi:uncharacterized protein
MKTVCIYHSVDLDGWMSAAIVKHWFNQQEVPTSTPGVFNTIDFLGWNYGNDIPDLSEYDRVIMCDISLPKDTMEWLGYTKDFIWLDHHISVFKDNHPAWDWVNRSNEEAFSMKGIRNTKFAACELTWKYFFPNEIMPEIVRLLGRYDCFGHKGTSEETIVLEFQYGARGAISNYEEAYAWLIKSIEHRSSSYLSPENEIYNRGIGAYKYLLGEAKQIYKNGFPIYFRFSPTTHKELGFDTDTMYKFLCINREQFNPINFGIDYHADGYDGVATFHYSGKVWKFSIYNNNNEVDCSVIAKSFSGGGHKGASGFIINDIQSFLMPRIIAI